MPLPIMKTAQVPSRNEEHEKYGDFYAIQEADVDTELDIEKRLFESMMTLHNSVSIDDADEVWSITHGTIGAIEYAKQLLVKYIGKNADFIIKINATIKELRDNEMDIESIIDVYQPLRDEMLETFAWLGFRRAKNPTYKWTQKTVEKIQKPNIPAEIIEPKKKQKKSKGSAA